MPAKVNKYAFNATNAPSTCLWCGTRLAHHYYTETEASDRRPRRCMIVDLNGESCRSTRIERDEEGNWRCERDHRLDKPRHVIKRTPVHEKPGYLGDGHFCSLGCGYRFGLGFAKIGKRLTSVRDEDATTP
jgi:hypothetical protein